MEPNTRFLFDTGTTVTEITVAVAATLGLDPETPDFWQEMSGGSKLPGYLPGFDHHDRRGKDLYGTDAPVLAVSTLGGAADAVIGSNLFSQVKLLWDGPNATLGIGVATNAAPVADAGEDQVIEATGPTTSFTLDGIGFQRPGRRRAHLQLEGERQ